MPTTMWLWTLYFVASSQYDLSQPQIAINRYDTCFSQHGHVACWGFNAYGQLGRGDTEPFDGINEIVLDPIDLGDDFVVKLVSGGCDSHHCAVSVDGRLKCWGENGFGMFDVI